MNRGPRFMQGPGVAFDPITGSSHKIEPKELDVINVFYSHRTKCFFIEAPINEVVCRRLYATDRMEMMKVISDEVSYGRIMPITHEDKLQLWDDIRDLVIPAVDYTAMFDIVEADINDLL